MRIGSEKIMWFIWGALWTALALIALGPWVVYALRWAS